MKNNFYCIHCGTKNKKEEKKCKKCNKSLHPKCLVLKEYLLDHIKDDLKSDVQDTIIDLLKAWIVSHLYGIGITAAVLFTATTFVTKEVPSLKVKQDYKQIEEPVAITITCSDLNLVEQEKVCDEGFTLENDQCIKQTYNKPINHMHCPENFSLIGDTCVSNYNINWTETKTCSQTPSNYIREFNAANVLYSFEDNGMCYIKYCIDRLYTPGTTCTYEEVYEAEWNYSYSCNEYRDGNGNCKEIGKKSYTFTCDVGKLKGDYCALYNVLMDMYTIIIVMPVKRRMLR